MILDRVIERFVDPENLVIVLVSKAADILEELKTLGKVEKRGYELCGLCVKRDPNVC